MDIQGHEAQICPNRFNPKTSSQSLKNQRQNFESSKRKMSHHIKGNSADFSPEILQARREWDDIFKMVKEKNNLPNKNTLPSKVVS